MDDPGNPVLLLVNRIRILHDMKVKQFQIFPENLVPEERQIDLRLKTIVTRV
jgi:hypothetical protein